MIEMKDDLIEQGGDAPLYIPQSRIIEGVGHD